MRFTASKAPLVLNCSWWARSEVNAPEADPGPSARIGTVVGARLAAVLEQRPDPGNGDLLPEEANDADAYFEASVRWAKKRSRIGTRCEVKYAYSPTRDEGRELPKSDKLRDYSEAKEDEVCGSSDLVDFDMDGCLLLEDMKTGVTPLAHYQPQIRVLGLMAARASKVRKVRIRLVKLYKDRDAEVWEETLGSIALDAIAADLRIRLSEEMKSQPWPGSHCTEMWCPARLVCPEVPAVIAELVPATSLVKTPKLSHEFISHDHDAKMLEFLRLVEAWAKDMKTLIKNRTPEDGVMLEDGRHFREGFHKETRFKQDLLISKVRELATGLGMTDQDIDLAVASCQYTFEKSEGLKAVKALKGKAA